MSQEESLNTLKSMFTEVDDEVLLAVLEANQGALEPSINTLLGMSDPGFKSEENVANVIPESNIVTSTSREQLQQDEELARKLATEANIGYGPPPPHLNPTTTQQEQEQQQQSEFPFADELPVIKDKLVNAADVTKKKVKEWYEKIKQQARTYNDDEDDDYSNHTTSNQYTNLPRNEPGTWAVPSPNQNQQATGGLGSRYSASTARSQQQRSTLGSSGGNGVRGPTTVESSDVRTDEPIKIIRQNSNSSQKNSSSSPPALSSAKNAESEVTPYAIFDDTESENLVDKTESEPPVIPTVTSPQRYDLSRASSADAEEIGKHLQ